MSNLYPTVEFILYVASQQRSRDFYAALLHLEPALDVPGMTEFYLNEYCKLGLMPESGIEKIITPATQPPSAGNGIPRCELYIYVNSAEEYYDRAGALQALLISPPQPRDWGDKVCYFADPDGHIVALAERL